MSNAGSVPGKGKKGNGKKKSIVNEKAIFVWQALVVRILSKGKGSKVLVVLFNGAQYQGIFHTWAGNFSLDDY